VDGLRRRRRKKHDHVGEIFRRHPASRIGFGIAERFSGVSMTVGSTQLTLMFSSRSSAAIVSVSRITAPGYPHGYEVQHWLKAETLWLEEHRLHSEPEYSKPVRSKRKNGQSNRNHRKTIVIPRH